jgi:hypothetical protein
MHAHQVVSRVMQNQIQVVKVHDAMKASGQIMEQFAQITVMRNGFGHFEKRLVAGFWGSLRQLAHGDVVHDWRITPQFAASQLDCSGLRARFMNRAASMVVQFARIENHREKL